MTKILIILITIFSINLQAEVFSTNKYENNLQNDCLIDDVIVEVTACEEELFDVGLNFVFQNTSDSFRIQGNGMNYGHFSYNDVPITLVSLTADCETPYEFAIIDLEYEECSAFTELGVVCCEAEECALTNLILTPSDCNNNIHHNLTIDFDYQDPGNDFFELQINNEFIGYYPLILLPITVTLDGTTNELDFVLICLYDVPDCCIDGSIENPCFTSQNCFIDDISTEVTDCEEELFDVSIDFVFQNTSDSFRIQGNGVNYGNFSYNDVPITLTSLAANCETLYEFVIIDLEYEECSAFTELGVIYCEPASNNTLLLDKIKINKISSNIIQIDFNNIEFDFAKVNIVNAVGQNLLNKQIDNKSTNKVYNLRYNQNGLILVQVIISTKNTKNIIVKKFISLLNKY